MPNIKRSIILMSVIFVASLFATQIAIAETIPFKMSDLSTGIIVADSDGKNSDGKKCDKSKKMKKMDTNQDGNVSKDEYMAYSEKKFSKKDKNGDGVLSEDEMKRKKYRTDS